MLTLPVAPAPFPEQPAPLENQLVEEWTAFAYTIAGEYFLPGGDLADLRQEALIGLVKGLRDFDPDLDVPLKSFLRLTIDRQVLTAVKTAARFKHRPLTESMRVIVLEGETVDAVDAFADPRSDPHLQLVERMELRECLDRIPFLSWTEQRALVGVALGVPYLQIDKDEKRVDNALQRARRKLREAA